MKSNLLNLIKPTFLVIIGFTVGIALSNSIADEPKQTVSSEECTDSDGFQEFMKATKEEMVFAGLHAVSKKSTSEFTVMVITMNNVTGDWSQFEIMENGTVCYITGGAAGRNISSKKVGFNS